MHLTQFFFLDAISKNGSISKAAEQLYVSHSTISKAIKNLEEELGFQILNKVPTGITFTLKGERVLSYAQNILVIIEEINNLREISDCQKKQTICMGISASISKYFLSGILSFQNENKIVTIRYRESTGYDIFESIDRGVLDLGVAVLYKTDEKNIFKKSYHSNFQIELIHKGDVCFAVHNNHPLAQQHNKIKMSDLVQYQYFTSGGEEMAKNIATFLQKYGYSKDVGIISNREELLNYAAENDCIISFPSGIFDSLYKNDRFTKLQISRLHLTYSIFLAYNKTSSNEKTLEQIITLIKDKIAML